MVKYGNISIPTDLLDEVEQKIKKSKKGYRNRSEFIIESIREKLKEN